MFLLSIFQRLFGGEAAAAPDAPEAFGYKIGWLCVRTTDEQAVAKALGLENTKPATWKEGIHKVYGEKRYPYRLVFVSPPVDGWTFAVGSWVVEVGGETEPQKDVLRLEELATRLSSQFGEAQAFVSHRVVDYHVWILARGGKLVRSFGYLGEEGEVLRNEGAVTDAESGFDWKALNTDWFPAEENVMSVAGKWSIDPTSLENHPVSESLGLLGEAH